MVKNIKFHAIAISIISVVIIVLYMAIGPKPTAQPDANAALNPAGHYVRIAGATWGQNCDPFIDEALRTQQATPIVTDASGKPVPLKPLAHVSVNNVLPTVKRICDGKMGCEVLANSDILGTEPLEACYKRLVIQYRCFDLDRVTSKEVDQGQLVKIDCTPQASNEPAPAASNP